MDTTEPPVFPEGPGFETAPGASAAAPVPPPPRIPWEERERWGWPSALWRTIKRSMGAPGEFFRELAPAGGYGPALLYAMILGFVGILGAFLWQSVLENWLAGLGLVDADLLSRTSRFFSFWVLVLLSPVLIALRLGFWSVLTHLFLMIAGGAHRGFQGTFRTIAYSQGPSLIELLPVCGSVVAFIWTIVLEIVGLAAVHGTTRGRAAFAVLAPLLILLGLGLIAIVIAASLLGALGGALGGS
jgi:hypothetical protein